MKKGLDPSLNAISTVFIVFTVFAVLITEPDSRIHLLRMIGTRLKRRPQDLPALREIPLQIVTDSRLQLAGSSADYHWNLLAKALLPDHARAIARTIFAGQARPSEASFSLEYSAAKETLDACIAANATAVWEELAICLGQGPRSERFVIDFQIT